MERVFKEYIGKSVVIYLKGGTQITDVRITKVTNGIDPLIYCNTCFGRKSFFRINDISGFTEWDTKKGVFGDGEV